MTEVCKNTLKNYRVTLTTKLEVEIDLKASSQEDAEYRALAWSLSNDLIESQTHGYWCGESYNPEIVDMIAMPLCIEIDDIKEVIELDDDEE